MTSPSCAAITALCNCAVFVTSIVAARAGDVNPNVAATRPATTVGRRADVSIVLSRPTARSRTDDDRAVKYPACSVVAVRELDREASRVGDEPRPTRSRDRDREADVALRGTDLGVAAEERRAAPGFDDDLLQPQGLEANAPRSIVVGDISASLPVRRVEEKGGECVAGANRAVSMNVRLRLPQAFRVAACGPLPLLRAIRTRAARRRAARGRNGAEREGPQVALISGRPAL